jgi:hypothetical protein
MASRPWEHHRGPVAYMKRNAGRVRMRHCEDAPREPPYHLTGDGVIHWKPLFAAEAVGGIEACSIGQDRYPEPLTAMQCAGRTLRNFEKHG